MTVGVNIRHGADLSMTQPPGDGHTVHAVKVEHGGHFIPESVGIDVGEAVTFGELVKPICHAVRVHW